MRASTCMQVNTCQSFTSVGGCVSTAKELSLKNFFFEKSGSGAGIIVTNKTNQNVFVATFLKIPKNSELLL